MLCGTIKMGTNYYFSDGKICECCNSILKKDNHIGKNSHGNYFVFMKNENYESFVEFKEYLRNSCVTKIIDEYQEEVTYEELIDTIEKSKKGKHFKYPELHHVRFDDENFAFWDNEFS